MKNRDQEAKDDQTTLERTAEALEAGDGVEDLDIEGLDLSVETVEERISPGETNVFDK